MPAECSGASCRKRSNGKCIQSGSSWTSEAHQNGCNCHESVSSLTDGCKELRKFWDNLSVADRRRILRVEKKDLFKQIRCLYCSRCYGLFQLRYEELQGNPPSDCPTCKECYSSLVVAEDGSLQLQDDIVMSDPFQKFQDAKHRERERELQFMTGNICGNGWAKRPGQNMCSLHTTPVPCEALAEYWCNLPEDHRTALFCLPEEDFVADMDAHLKYQLKICRDCRSNVMRSFKDLKSGKNVGQPLDLCEGHMLTVKGGAVRVDGPGGAVLFEKAEEVEENKIAEGDFDADVSHSDEIRHAETPALAQEALQECALLIFKSQTEVAFREQSAGHNALLLFVFLTLQIMEQNLMNAFKELSVKQAEAELMELLAVEHVPAKKNGKKSKTKKKKAGKASPSVSPVQEAAVATEEESQEARVSEPETAQSRDHAETETISNGSDKSVVQHSIRVQELHNSEDAAAVEDSVNESGNKTGTDSLSTGDSSHIEDRTEDKHSKESDVQHLEREEWPTLQESNSRLHNIKVPTLQGDGEVIMVDQVILVGDQGEATPPGDFRIHALSSLKEHDVGSMLGIPGDGIEGSQVVDTPVSKYPCSQIGEAMCHTHFAEDHFSLFHKFPGDYTRVNAPSRGSHMERLHLEKMPKPTEFDQCYTLFGDDQWNPLVSVLKRSLLPLSQQNT